MASSSSALASQSRQVMDGMIRDVLTSSPLLEGMIAQAVRGYVDPQLKEFQSKLQQLEDDLVLKRRDDELQGSEYARQEVSRLDKDLEALREYTRKATGEVWGQLTTLSGKIQEISPQKEEDILADEADKDRRSSIESRMSAIRRRKSRGKKSSGRRKHRAKYYASESSSDQSDSDRSSDGSLESETEDIRTADRACRKAMSVETYRLINRATERSKRWSTNKMVNTVRHLFKGDNFDGSDPISVLIFLEEIKSAFDDAEIGEGDAKHLVRYFLEGDAERLFKGLGSRDRNSYPRILRWLLRTYVRETMLQDAREAFLTRTQRSNETELDYSKELRVLARRCGGMIPDRDVTHRFVRGLQPAIRTQVQMQVKRDTTWPTVVALAADFGNSHRDASRDSKARDESRLLAPARRRSSELGRTLLVQPTPGNRTEISSDDEELIQQFESLDMPEDGATIATLSGGGRIFPNSPSHLSISSGGGSSASYRTARGGFSPSPITYAPPRAERRVMLPPGIPFPSRQTSTSPKQVCWGCGLEGHFLSGCKTTDPRLIEIALEGIRSRKRERAARAAPTAQNIPQFPGRSVVFEQRAIRHAPPPRSFPARQVGAMLVKDEGSDASASGSHPAAEQDKAI